MLRISLLLIIGVGLNIFTYAQSTVFQRQLRFSNVLFEQGISLADLDDGYILAGNTIACSNGSCDFSCALAKTDESGQIQWVNRYGTATIPFNSVKVIRGNEESIILLGRGFEATPRDNSSLFLVKVDSLGNVIWKILCGGADDEEPTNVLAIDGGYIVTGFARDDDNDPHGFICKITEAGQLDWFKLFGFQEYELQVTASVLNDQGHIVVATGYKDYPIYNLALIEFDQSGNIVRKKRFFDPDDQVSNIIEDMVLSDDNGYVISVRGSNNKSSYAFKFDADLEVEWGRRYMDNINFYRAKVALANHYGDDGYWMGGTAGNSNYSFNTWHRLNGQGEIMNSFQFDSPLEDNLNAIVPVNYCQLGLIGRTKASGSYKWWFAVTDSTGNPGCADSTFTLQEEPATIEMDSLNIEFFDYETSLVSTPTLRESSSMIENDSFCIDAVETCAIPVIGSVEEPNLGKIATYPNPFTEQITIQLQSRLTHDVYSLSLIDLAGREVWSKSMELSEQSATISGFERLAPGPYILRGITNLDVFTATVIKN